MTRRGVIKTVLAKERRTPQNEVLHPAYLENLVLFTKLCKVKKVNPKVLGDFYLSGKY